MAKGYYVLSNGEPEEFTGRGCYIKALKRLVDMVEKENQTDVHVMHFDDANENGFMAGEDAVSYKEAKATLSANKR